MRLSKSKVMTGLQCPKALYLTIHRPELAPEISSAQQNVFDQGNRVGIEAQKRFPGGILVDVPHTELGKALVMTEQLIAAGALVIYEATFNFQDVLVRVDVLHRTKVGGAWSITEVKSTTGVKDQHIEDAAVQTWVLRGAGLSVSSVAIMHINNQCVYPELDELFTSLDVTEAVEALVPGIPEKVARLQEVLAGPVGPELDIGEHCDAPYECGFKAHCFGEKKVPELSVFDVPGLKTTRKWELYRRGVVDLAQLLAAEEKLTPAQQRMVSVSVSGKRHLDREAVERELSKWKYPLYFLDFEAMAPAIPRFQGVRPFEQVPFQFSCHAQMEPGGMLTHEEYLHDEASDPREPLIVALLKAVGTSGSVVAYNKSFESMCIGSLAKAFPKYAAELLPIRERLVDPLPVFKAHVYDRGFRGSFSIKAVAPALLGEAASYDGMEVGDGAGAQVGFEELVAVGTLPARRGELKKAMIEYCRKDTLGLVQLVDWLNRPPELE